MAGWRHRGSPGRLLDVDLSSGKITEVHLEREQILRTIGGKSLATELLVERDTTDYSEAMALRHPLSGNPHPSAHPTTPLLIMTGPFQGTKIGSAGRAVICTRSPLTDVYIDTYIGGDFSHDLRLAGWDGLFIHGAAESLSRIVIDDLDARLESCESLLGKTTWETEKDLQDDGKCISIGPAGESGVRIASPLTDGRRAAGRGGTGAQFGFKNLKAISVKASGEANFASIEALSDAIKRQRSEMGALRKNGDPFYRFGTSNAPRYAADYSRMPTANYQSTTGSIPVAGSKDIRSKLDVDRLTGRVWHEELPDAKQSSCCSPCPIACEAADRPEGVKGRPKHVEEVDRPEYETLAMMGANLGIESSLDVMRGNDACNQLGIDTISAGAALSLMCEVTERGWAPEGWEEFEGRKWAFGDAELPMHALRKMSEANPGDGTLFGTLACGAVPASRYLEKLTGYPVTNLTAHCKGLDLPAWDPRGKRGNAVAYMTSNVGASHMRAEYKSPTGLPDSSALDLMDELVVSQNAIVVRDSLILCAFARGATHDDVIVDAYNSIVGDNATWEDLLVRANRQWNQARQWNVEHWQRLNLLPREQDLLSNRLRFDPLPDGIAKGMTSFVNTTDESDCLSKYYELRGWSNDGVPAIG